MSGSSDKKISALDAVSSLDGTEVRPVVQAGATKSATSMDDVRLAAAKRAGLIFNTVAEAQALVAALSLPLGAIISTRAYATAGDGGGAPYELVAEQPSHSAWFLAGGYWELRVTVFKPEMVGAVGLSPSDDTAAFLTGAAYIENGGTIELTAGRSYGISEWPLPSKKMSIVCSGPAQIRAVNTGNTKFIMATYSWHSGSAGAGGDPPIYVSGVNFDALSVKDHCVICTALGSEFFECEFTGGVVSGSRLTNYTATGADTSSSISGTRWTLCRWRANGGDGFGADDGVADFHIIGGRTYSNGGWGINAKSWAGAQMTNHNIWGNTLGTADIYKFRDGIVNCNFDGKVVIHSAAAAGYPMIFGPGNTIKTAPLEARLLRTDPGNIVLRVVGCNLQGPGAYVYHDYNDPSRLVILDGGNSDDPQPVRHNTTSPIGKFLAFKHWNSAAGGFLDGIIQRAISTWTSPIAPNSLFLDKALNSTGPTDIVLTLALPTGQQSGSSIRVKVDIEGLYTPGPVVAPYMCDVYAVVQRRLGNASYRADAKVLNVSTPADSSTVVTASWGVTGGSADQVAVLTISIAHEPQFNAGTTMVRASVDATHRYTTAMTLA